MASLGEFLRQERERRGVSLDDVARVTRVRRQHLEALEADRLADLPAAPFVRGFLQAYARYLGLATADVLGRYQEASPSAAAAPTVPSPSPARKDDHGAHGAEPVRPAAVRYRGVLALAGLVGVGAIAVLGSMLLRPPAEVRVVRAPVPRATAAVVPSPDPVAAEDAPGPEAAPAPAEGGASADAPPAPPAASSPSPALSEAGATQSPARPTSTLAIAATEEAWVQLVIDGADPVEALLQPGERVAWRGGTFDIVVGNAGGVSLELDGVRQPPLGPSGRRAVLTLPHP